MPVVLSLPDRRAGCDIAAPRTPGPPHARFEEIAIEPRHARLVIAVQRGVDAEEQKILRIEADVHVPEMLQRLQEQSGTDQQHQRDRDLDDEECLAGRLESDNAAACFLQRHSGAHRRTAQGGRDPEHDPVIPVITAMKARMRQSSDGMRSVGPGNSCFPQ